jgi:hypothetical protein
MKFLQSQSRKKLIIRIAQKCRRPKIDLLWNEVIFDQFIKNKFDKIFCKKLLKTITNWLEFCYNSKPSYLNNEEYKYLLDMGFRRWEIR